MPKQEIAREEKSLGDLFAALAADTSTLVRQEIALAQTEVTYKVTRAGKGLGFLAVGGAVAYTAVLAFAAAVVLLLAQFIPAWIAALVVAAVVGLISYFMVTAALHKLKTTDPLPRNTIDTVKEDVRWLKKEIS